MKSLSIFTSILALFLFQNSLSAQRNIKERAVDRHQIKKGAINLERDVKELDAFKAKIVAFKTAFENGNKDRLRNLKLEILGDMEREIRQTEAKLAQAKVEVKQSKSEVRSDNREIRNDRKDLKRGGDPIRDDVKDLARDKHDRRDDVRDLRDDVNDVDGLQRRLTNQQRLYTALKAVTFSRGATRGEKVAANKALISDFVLTMQNDIKATKREIGEDIGELKEDRKETRDDRRERNERR